MSDKGLSRLAAGLSILAFLFILAAVPVSYLGRSADIPPELYSWPFNLIYLAAPAAFVLVGSLIAIRQPRNAYGWVMLAFGIGQGSIQGFWTGYGVYSYHVAPQPPPLAAWAFILIPMGWLLLFCSIPLILLLYPSGRLPSPRWKPAVFLLGIAFAVGCSIGWLGTGSMGWIAVNNPYLVTGVAGQAIEVLTYILFIYVFLLIIASAISVVVRARRSSGVERQQYKWFAYAAALLLFELILDFFWEPPQPWEGFKETIPLVLLAVAIGIAVLRYRLFDIDLIIRRTLVYAALSAMLAFVFFGGVALLQQIFGGLTGTENSPVAIVLSTLAIAALFNPLRHRVQDFIDRRFYRKKYNAEQALARFAAVARDETDIEQLSAELVAVVQETMQPDRVSLWLAKSKKRNM